MADINKNDHILEIGPGAGVLTVELANRAAKVTAIEMDIKFKPLLHSIFGNDNSVEFIWGDANKFGLSGDKMKQFTKIVSNLPYSSASRILAEIVTGKYCPARIVVMVQKEVAERIIAEATHPRRGLLSTWIQAKYSPRIVKKISRNCFWPKPQVESALVCLEKLAMPVVNLMFESTYFEITKLCFQHRRKQVGTIISHIFKESDAVLKNAGIKPSSRTDELSVEEWSKLAEVIYWKKKEGEENVHDRFCG